MKIVHLSTFDIRGGAARAAYRLHQGLLAIEKDSQILCLYKASSDSLVFQYQGNISHQESQPYDLIQKYYIDSNRTEISNTLFSLGYSGCDLTYSDIVKDSDIINLHWINNSFLSPVNIRQLMELGKPVIWTFHDMWAFTGGCHYSAGCEGYQEDCHSCPQLLEDTYKLPYHLLQDKIELFSHPNLVIVTPSQWLTECVKKSQLFCHHRVETIPYSLDENIFFPTEKTEAKRKLNINPDIFILLIGAMTGKEQRKGFSELFTYLKLLKTDTNINYLITHGKIKIACFGESSDALRELEIEVINWGNINDDRDLSLIYSAADIFILPSLEDNFPNTMLEAMSCATPVIGFAVGGMIDLIKDDINGVLIPAYNLDLMAKKIIELINHPDKCRRLGINARREIETNYSLTIQAEKYSNLYNDLLTKNEDKLQILDNKKLEILSNSMDDIVNYSQQHLRGKYFEKIYDDIALNSLNRELISADITLDNLNEKLALTDNLLEEKKLELEKTQKMLTESEIMLEAMKSSKFWRLREKWFKLKKILGLPNK